MDRFGLSLILLCAVLLPQPAWARREQVLARVTTHADGSCTHTVKSSGDRVMEQLTYNPNRVLLMKRIFQLDRQGRVLSGVAFDGKSNLLFTMRYMFDKQGRLAEEQIYDKDNSLVRLLRHTYDAEGKPRVQAVTTADGKNTPEWFRAIMHPDQLHKEGSSETKAAPGAKPSSSSKKR